jgi:polar amino acid transport system substrate-binding protein
MSSCPITKRLRLFHVPAWLCLAGAGLLFALPGTVAAADRAVLILNDTNEPPFTSEKGDGFLDIIAGEAFRRIGVELRLVKLPAERALINANAGIQDGDLSRIAGLDKQYPNLVRVPEKLVDWEFTAFSKDTSIPSDWKAIRKRPVGHIKGWKIYEQQLAGSERITTADDPEQLFRLLSVNRIDVALYERSFGAELARRQSLKDVQPLAPLLATREMFIYLHKKHAALVPALANALRAIKREGLYARVCREKLAVIAPQTRQCEVK